MLTASAAVAAFSSRSVEAEGIYASPIDLLICDGVNMQVDKSVPYNTGIDDDRRRNGGGIYICGGDERPV